MATRKTTALATRKSAPADQPITKPRQVIAKKSSVITPEDELAVVALQISDVRDDGDVEELTDKTIALLESYPMNGVLRDVAKSIAEQTDVENVMDELARLCAVVLLAQERCSQG